jgi:hypothetical protein
MEFPLFGYLNNFSLHTSLIDLPTTDINKKKTERIAIKDSEWPEIHTTTVAGYIHNPAQHGYDGHDDIRGKVCEVKSSSKVISYDLIEQFQLSPIDGRGVFSQFTHEAYQRHLEDEVMMLISAYINGVLMFIIEFPFKHSTFASHIKARLESELPGGDKPGRSKTVSFAYTSYKDCREARLIYLTPEINHKILKGACTKNFYSYLQTLKRR